jgi:hypothetical protein
METNCKRKILYRRKLQNEVSMETVTHRPTLTKHGKTLEGVQLSELIGVGNFGT